jgi:hypothetical protein
MQLTSTWLAGAVTVFVLKVNLTATSHAPCMFAMSVIVGLRSATEYLPVERWHGLLLIGMLLSI